MSFRKPILLRHSLTEANLNSFTFNVCILLEFFFNLTLPVEIPGKVQFPHLGKTLSHQIPYSPGMKSSSMPGVMPKEEGATEMGVEHLN